MKQRSKQEVLEFIRDLSGPIDPEIYAGYGSELERRLERDHLVADEIIDEWFQNSEQTPLLAVLVEIACGSQLEEMFASHKKRFKLDWEFVLTQLIDGICCKDEKLFTNVLAELDASAEAQNISSELKLWWSEGIS